MLQNIYENTNENGGAAYFIPSDKTGADGVYHVESRAIADLLDRLGVAYDVEIVDMPTLDDVGMLSLNLPAFRNSGAADAMQKGGVFGYIHKRQDNCDVYFFSNSTMADYDGDVLLRGELINPELWNPHNGKIRRAEYEKVSYRGEIYTKLPLKLASAESVFIVSGDERDIFDFIRDKGDQPIEEFVPENAPKPIKPLD